MKKQILPLLALRGKMVYPDTSVYFEVSRPKSMAALEQAVNHEQQIFLVNQIDPSIDKPDQEDLYTVGTIAKILQMVKAGQGVLRVFVEAGVRNLERTIGQLMHKAARKIVEGEKEVDIKKKSLKELLGSAPFEDEDENLKPQIGVVRGLAWTSVGGDTLSIEVNVMPGKGKMELTGCMGDVMKESAQIGLSYVRSIAEAYGIDSDYFEKHDIHLHIPEGAVPKDGPSAGITMALAILSAITEIPVRGDIAMTGEITLRGKVLPIGGLKEKLLAAKIVGVKEVLVPARNKRNVAELDEEIISGLKITYVEEMNEVIKCALKK